MTFKSYNLHAVDFNFLVEKFNQFFSNHKFLNIFKFNLLKNDNYLIAQPCTKYITRKIATTAGKIISF